MHDCYINYYCVCQNSTDSPNKVCLVTRVNPCCPVANFSLGNLVSSAKVNLNGEDVTVAYYLTQEGTGKHSMPVANLCVLKGLTSWEQLQHVSSVLNREGSSFQEFIITPRACARGKTISLSSLSSARKSSDLAF